jgi:uncharacterized protein YjbJ (UPF0337 family)
MYVGAKATHTYAPTSALNYMLTFPPPPSLCVVSTAGTGEVKAATAKAHMDATGTKAQGTMEKVIGNVTGDKSKQMEGDAHKTQGDVQHRAA